jgi:GT2 family glycosyltransferase
LGEDEQMKIALLVSYYNRPDLLRLCLTSVMMQARKPDQLIICDDASPVAPPNEFPVDLYIRRKVHDGFGKELVVNRALLETNCDYIVVLDQDCVVARDFLWWHESLARRGQIMCSMYSSLTQEESAAVDATKIIMGSIWSWETPRYGSTPNVWCGAGSAVWREDALAVNGFDNRFGVVGPDYNFGLRLERMGLSWDHLCRYTRYFHLWHDRPYLFDKTDWRAGNKALANEYARKWAEESIVTPMGIEQLDPNEFEVRRSL